jgi:hypothetical protein
METENEFKYRCPICYQIPFLSSNFNDQNLIINMKCINNHENKDEISNIQNKIFKCNKCGETKNKEFYYCGNCTKILCNKCCDSHKNEAHKIIELNNVDFICSEHNNNFVGYCQKHNINYCKDCQHFKENNSNVFKELSDKEISNFIEINNKNESLLLDFDKHFQTLKKYFEDVQRIYNLFKNNIENKIKFYKEIINLYNKNKKHKINYQMIKNLYDNQFNINPLILEGSKIINNMIDNFNKINKIFYLNDNKSLNINKITFENKSNNNEKNMKKSNIMNLNENEAEKNDVIRRKKKSLTFKRSKILLNELYINSINSFFSKPKKFKLIYSASRDGDTTEKFYSKCDDKAPTLVISKNIDGIILGGYTEKKWSCKNYKKNIIDNNSFIFNLTKNEKYKALKNMACIVNFENGFGFGDYGNDLYFNSPFFSYESNGINSRGSYDYTGGKIQNKLSELEVYLVEN